MFTKKDIIINRYLSGERTRNICKDYGVSYVTILRWLKKWNVKIKCRSEAIHLSKTKSYKWTIKQKEILDGELLGDGCLTKYNDRKYGNYIFVLGSIIQEHCLNIKRLFPKGIFNNKTPYHIKSERFRKGIFYCLRSRSDPYLTEQRKRWYPQGVKIVPQDIKITPVVLYYWYIGDGCLVRRKGRIKNIQLSTDGFSNENLILLKEKMLDLNLKVSICNKRLLIFRGETKRLLNLLPKNKIKGYDYKFLNKDILQK